MVSESIRLNNKAIILLKKGEYKKAVLVFYAALKRFCNTKEGSSIHTKCNPLSSKSNDFSIFNATPIEDHRGLIPNNEDELFVIYRSAMAIVEPNGGFLQKTQVDRFQLSSVLIYNAGLAHHLLGMTGESQKEHLHKALEFYRRAIHVLNRIPPSAAAMSGNIGKLGSLNNQVHIYSHLFEVLRARLSLLTLYETVYEYAPCFRLHHGSLDPLSFFWETMELQERCGDTLLVSHARAA